MVIILVELYCINYMYSLLECAFKYLLASLVLQSRIQYYIHKD